MADFNSRYTGAEIEAAIARTEKIGEFVTVWSGTPTDTPIALSSLPENPATGDRTGLYYVQYSNSNNSSAGESTSSIYISDESKSVVGSGHSSIDNSTPPTIYVTIGLYDGTSLLSEYQSVNTDGGAYNGGHPLFIHKIFRFQQAQ